MKPDRRRNDEATRPHPSQWNGMNIMINPIHEQIKIIGSCMILDISHPNFMEVKGITGGILTI